MDLAADEEDIIMNLSPFPSWGIWGVWQSQGIFSLTTYFSVKKCKGAKAEEAGPGRIVIDLLFLGYEFRHHRWIPKTLWLGFRPLVYLGYLC